MRMARFCAAVVIAAVLVFAGTEGAVVDVSKLARETVKRAAEKHISLLNFASRQDGPMRVRVKCESSITQSEYEKPIATFVSSTTCESGGESASESMEEPLDVTGVPVTATCDAEEYVNSVDCGAFSRVQITVESDGESEIPRITFDDLNVWTFCKVQGETSCGSSYILERPDPDQPVYIPTDGERFVTELQSGSMKAAFAAVFYGDANVDSLFAQATSRADISRSAAVTRAVMIDGVAREEEGGAPLLAYLMQGSVGGLSSVGGAGPNLQDQFDNAIEGNNNAPSQASPTAVPVATATPGPDGATATPLPTATATLGPQPSNQPESTATPTPAPVCIDAAWVAAHHVGFEVHSTPTMAKVLCYKSLPCATGGHIVTRDGKLLTMEMLCSIEECTQSEMLVNGVQHRRAQLMPCDGNVCMTTLDARANTLWKQAENAAVYYMLQTGHSGLAEQLTRIQLASAGRS
mmetsp:Transcript_8816/g.23131  ORF Transcript_8816/g.23131 Transcript_8816/m.23131 type:complete len:465 (-) Transcript_8816:259-1653(-)